MDQRAIGIIAGTSEGKETSEYFKDRFRCHVFCATSMGAAMIDQERCILHTGRLEWEGFYQAFAGLFAVIDASHPFAREVTKTVKAVCRERNLPYIRYLRETQEYAYPGIIYADNPGEACRILNQISGNIGFTTGVNTLPFYQKYVKGFSERAVARILPSKITVSCRTVMAFPPFSIEDNLALIQKYRLAVLVSKDSGSRGGVPEKAAACEQAGIPMVLISAPREDGCICRDLEEIAAYLKDLE